MLLSATFELIISVIAGTYGVAAPATNFSDFFSCLGMQMSETGAINFKPVEDALKNLREALQIKNPSKLERDGTVQRFEYSYELVWKLASRILKENEVNAEVPKSVFRELGRLAWIDNVETWIDFQKSRNETSHEYGETLAQKSYQLADKFLPIAEKLIVILRQKSS